MGKRWANEKRARPAIAAAPSSLLDCRPVRSAGSISRHADVSRRHSCRPMSSATSSSWRNSLNARRGRLPGRVAGADGGRRPAAGRATASGATARSGVAVGGAHNGEPRGHRPTDWYAPAAAWWLRRAQRPGPHAPAGDRRESLPPKASPPPSSPSSRDLRRRPGSPIPTPMPRRRAVRPRRRPGRWPRPSGPTGSMAATASASGTGAPTDVDRQDAAARPHHRADRRRRRAKRSPPDERQSAA
jgi:hypothetical protein